MSIYNEHSTYQTTQSSDYQIGRRRHCVRFGINGAPPRGGIRTNPRNCQSPAVKREEKAFRQALRMNMVPKRRGNQAIGPTVAVSGARLRINRETLARRYTHKPPRLPRCGSKREEEAFRRQVLKIQRHGKHRSGAGAGLSNP